MKRTPREPLQASDGLDPIILTEKEKPGKSAEGGSSHNFANDDQSQWQHWTEEVEPEWTPRLVNQNKSISMRPASKLIILRSKFQATQGNFCKQYLAQKEVAGNTPYETFTDGFLRSERPITKQQPRLISRNLRMPGRPANDELKIVDRDQQQRAKLSRMIEQAVRKHDRTRPPTSRGPRAKSQSIKIEAEEDHLMSQNEVPPSLANIPIKQMYRQKKKPSSGSQRRKSIDIDRMIKLNKTGKSKAVDVGELPFKTSLGTGFMNLFARDC